MKLNRALMICCGLTLAAGLALMSNGLAQVPPWSAHKPLTPPRHYSNVEKALRIAKALHLPAPPDVGGTIAFTANDLRGGGKVGVSIGPLRELQASKNNPDQSYAMLQPNGGLAVEFDVVAGKRYAFDCRLRVAKVNYHYNPFGFGDIGGSADTDTENHAVFATSAMPRTGEVSMRIALADASGSAPTDVVPWWGCEISPF